MERRWDQSRVRSAKLHGRPQQSGELDLPGLVQRQQGGAERVYFRHGYLGRVRKIGKGGEVGDWSDPAQIMAS